MYAVRTFRRVMWSPSGDRNCLRISVAASCLFLQSHHCMLHAHLEQTSIAWQDMGLALDQEAEMGIKTQLNTPCIQKHWVCACH